MVLPVLTLSRRADRRSDPLMRIQHYYGSTIRTTLKRRPRAACRAFTVTPSHVLHNALPVIPR
ncbi:hypothetical protein KCP76_22095 [Salmonella enterica subsp. enterica serovar Weltevreden]|nr:hypothetical protein KCP76_22095 [Salmonella enterica subsp. enterica serovar Weltevreden]